MEKTFLIFLSELFPAKNSVKNVKINEGKVTFPLKVQAEVLVLWSLKVTIKDF